MKNKEYVKLLTEIGVSVSFKNLTHLGTLKKKIDSGDITKEQLPAILSLGQNGGKPNRKERRKQLV